MHTQGREPTGQVLIESTVVQGVCVSDNGALVAIACDVDCIIFSPSSGSVLARLEGHMGDITCMAFSPCNKGQFITASMDRTFKVLEFILCFCWPLVLDATPPSLPARRRT